jgi:hypothetical protein
MRVGNLFLKIQAKNRASPLERTLLRGTKTVERLYRDIAPSLRKGAARACGIIVGILRRVDNINELTTPFPLSQACGRAAPNDHRCRPVHAKTPTRRIAGSACTS